MPPLLAAAEMLASPVANRTIPQASALPILEPVVAGPADTGPFMLMVTGAITGPWPRAQPVINAAQDNASTRLFNMDISPSLAVRPISRTQVASRFLLEKRDGAFFRLLACTASRPPARAATGERAMGKGIRKPLGAHGLGVNEELRAALGTAPKLSHCRRAGRIVSAG